MDPKDLLKDSYGQLQEWSKWLLTIEAAICAALWPKLTATPNGSFFLYLGWIFFVGSILTASVFVVLLAFFVQRLHHENTRDNLFVKLLVVVEYGFFILGVLSFFIRLTMVQVGL